MSDLEEQLSRDTGIGTLYYDTKKYVCCSLAASANNLFLSWTLTGALGFVLCLFASLRIMRHTLANRQ